MLHSTAPHSGSCGHILTFVTCVLCQRSPVVSEGGLQRRGIEIQSNRAEVPAEMGGFVSYSSDLTLLHQASLQSSLHTWMLVLSLSAQKPKHPSLQEVALAHRSWLLHVSDFSSLRQKRLLQISKKLLSMYYHPGQKELPSCHQPPASYWHPISCRRWRWLHLYFALPQKDLFPSLGLLCGGTRWSTCINELGLMSHHTFRDHDCANTHPPDILISFACSSLCSVSRPQIRPCSNRQDMYLN